MNDTKHINYRLSGGPADGYRITFSTDLVAIGVAFLATHPELATCARWAVYKAPDACGTDEHVFVFDCVRYASEIDNWFVDPSVLLLTSPEFRLGGLVMPVMPVQCRESAKELANELVDFSQYVDTMGVESPEAHAERTRQLERGHRFELESVRTPSADDQVGEDYEERYGDDRC